MFCPTHRHVHVTNRVSPREIGALHRLDITLLTETQPRPIYYLCQVSRIRLTSRIVRHFVRRNQRGYLLLTGAVDMTRIPIFPRQVGSL